jgi:hypothetical protein
MSHNEHNMPLRNLIEPVPVSAVWADGIAYIEERGAIFMVWYAYAAPHEGGREFRHVVAKIAMSREAFQRARCVIFDGAAAQWPTVEGISDGDDRSRH